MPCPSEKAQEIKDRLVKDSLIHVKELPIDNEGSKAIILDLKMIKKGLTFL